MTFHNSFLFWFRRSTESVANCRGVWSVALLLLAPRSTRSQAIARQFASLSNSAELACDGRLRRFWLLAGCLVVGKRSQQAGSSLIEVKCQAESPIPLSLSSYQRILNSLEANWWTNVNRTSQIRVAGEHCNDFLMERLRRGKESCFLQTECSCLLVGSAPLVG